MLGLGEAPCPLCLPHPQMALSVPGFKLPCHSPQYRSFHALIFGKHHLDFFFWWLLICIINLSLVSLLALSFFPFLDHISCERFINKRIEHSLERSVFDPSNTALGVTKA